MDYNPAPSLIDHPPRPQTSLIQRLHTRLDVLLERLALSGLPAEQTEPLGAALHDLVTKIEAAEQAVHAHEWAVALRAAQICEPLVQEALALARTAQSLHPRHPDPVAITQALWGWLITQPELYCKLHLIHLGLALRDPTDLDSDEDTEIIDFTGHVGEEIVRQAGLAEATVLDLWQTDRYRLYRALYTNFYRLRTYTDERGWVEESDALDYMMRLARMHGLHYHLWAPRSQPRTHPAGWQAPPRWERLAVLGRLLLDRFYWLTAGFGYRPLRALLVNAVVITGCALLFWYFNLLCVFTTGGMAAQIGVCQPVSFGQSLYFSTLAFLLAAMGEIIPRPPWGQILLVLESVWGFLNISVVIAVILNRQRN